MRRIGLGTITGGSPNSDAYAIETIVNPSVGPLTDVVLLGQRQWQQRIALGDAEYYLELTGPTVVNGMIPFWWISKRMWMSHCRSLVHGRIDR